MNWSKTPMAKGGSSVKRTLKRDKVHDSKIVWPENAFWKEYCKLSVELNTNEDGLTYPELCHKHSDVLVERV